MALIADWLYLHALDLETVGHCIEAIESRHLCLDLEGQAAAQGGGSVPGYASFEYALNTAICPSLSTALGIEICAVAEIVRSILWEEVSDGTHPHTIDHGAGQPSEIRMSWRSSVSDLICLAHEVAHTVQLRLSAGSFMPPVARETCAFLGELALIDWARQNDTHLAAKLLLVWREENQIYLSRDCDLLRSALADPASVYSYRMNYPLARAAAVVMRRSCADTQRLFRAGAEAMALLPLAHVADLAEQTQNYLPLFPPPDTVQPALDAYRALGAMTLLNIDLWKGESERRIEGYYASLLHHFQNRTVFIALDEVRRPIGYATWRKAAGDNAVTVTRQAAPFGDHLLLQKALQRHLGQDRDTVALHSRNARQEQTAW